MKDIKDIKEIKEMKEKERIFKGLTTRKTLMKIEIYATIL
jgi:hypothetical protein